MSEVPVWRRRIRRLTVFSQIGHISLLGLLSILGTLLGLGKTVLLTRFLPKEAFGALAYTWALIGLVDTFTVSGFHQAVLQYASKGVPGVLGAAIRERLKFYPLVLAVGGGVALYWLLLARDAEAAQLISAAVIVYPFTHMPVSVLHSLIGQRRYMLQGWISLGLDLGSFFIAVSCVTGRLTGSALWFLLGDALLHSLVLWALAFQEGKRDRGQVAGQNELADFRRYAFRMTGVGLVSSSQDRIDSLILGSMLGGRAFSDFALGLQFREQVKSLWMSYYKTAYAVYARSGAKEVQRMLRRDLALVLGGFGALTVAIVTVAPFGIPWLFSEKYESSIPYVAVILVGFWLSLPGALLEMVFRTRENTKGQYALRIGFLVLTIATTVPLIWRLGLAGAAASRLILGLAFSSLAIVVTTWARRRDAQ